MFMTQKLIRGKPIMISKIREIYRLHFEQDICNEKISQQVPCSKGSVFNYLNKLSLSSFEYSDVKTMSDDELLKLLRNRALFSEKREDCWPDFESLLDELTIPHVTCQVLWDEYHLSYPNGIKRTTFFNEISKRLSKVSPSLKMVHKGGEKLSLDYSGSKLEYFDVRTNQVVEVEVFVASFGASSYTYIECTPSQKKHDWVASNIRALEYFNGVPVYLVPDNLKSAVTTPSTYSPKINISYGRMSQYYNTTVMPARSLKPQDKPTVEANVKAVQGYIFPRLRNETFGSLLELNKAVWAQLEMFNKRLMQEYKMSRIDRFEKLDKPFLNSLPSIRYENVNVKLNITVNKTYHILYQCHYYSVPHKYILEKVEVRDNRTVIEIYRLGERIATHIKGFEDYKQTTNKAHMTSSHRFHVEFGWDYVCKEAEKVGPSMLELVKRIMNPQKKESEYLAKQAYSFVLLKRHYDSNDLEVSVKYILKAVGNGVPKIDVVESVLEQKLAITPHANDDDDELNSSHENIRGEDYYKKITNGESVC